jgi:hypothetical protein
MNPESLEQELLRWEQVVVFEERTCLLHTYSSKDICWDAR